MSRIPPFDDEFLEGVATSFRKRMKAMRHGGASDIEGNKVYREVDGGNRETLELNLGAGRGRPRMRIVIWHERWIWVDARVAAKQGWVWKWSYNGRLVGGKSGPNLVAAFEDTLAQLPHIDDSNTQELTAIWKPLLARGPVEVRPS
jgi:hypothetical protein